jgi:hypothetical protein
MGGALDLHTPKATSWLQSFLADGGFGENIDLMTGSVNLSFPIGPRYQVGPSLSCA